jgi:putative endonuclease
MPIPRYLKEPCVYMLASKRDGIIYVGVTSDLFGRVNLHKQGIFDGFTKKYRVHELVYYEMHHTMAEAFRREKQLKNRAWKVRLIEQLNPEWDDLCSKAGEIREVGSGGQELPSENMERL